MSPKIPSLTVLSLGHLFLTLAEPWIAEESWCLRVFFGRKQPPGEHRLVAVFFACRDRQLWVGSGRPLLADCCLS